MHSATARQGEVVRDVRGPGPGHVQRDTHVRRDARAWAQPKWNHACRVRLAGRGHRAFNPGTRVRIPHATPVQQQQALVELTLRGRKPAATIGRRRNPSPDGIRFVNSGARVPACLAGSRGFESRTERQDRTSLAQWIRAPAYEAGGCTFESCTGCHKDVIPCPVSVWRSRQRACFGSMRAQVRDLPPRPFFIACAWVWP